MKTVKRNGVFETNSSSVNCLTLVDILDFFKNYEETQKVFSGELTLNFRLHLRSDEEFENDENTSYETYDEKAMFLYTALVSSSVADSEKLNKLEKLLKDNNIKYTFENTDDYFKAQKRDNGIYDDDFWKWGFAEDDFTFSLKELVDDAIKDYEGLQYFFNYKYLQFSVQEQ